jgi:predicted enzyme related to lactoylglutathione lyase
MGLMSISLAQGSHCDQRQTDSERNSKMAVHYLEIVSDDADALIGLYQRMQGLSFGPPNPDLGQARVATQADGSRIGIRKPLAAHEQPIMRTYLAVDDIPQAIRTAEESGAMIAYPQLARETKAPLRS